MTDLLHQTSVTRGKAEQAWRHYAKLLKIPPEDSILYNLLQEIHTGLMEIEQELYRTRPKTGRDAT